MLWLTNAEQKGVSNATIAKYDTPRLGVIFPLHCTSVSVKNKHTEWFCEKGVELTLSKAALSPLPAGPSMPQYKLTYFNLRGRAEISRYLFAYSGKKYEDHRIEAADWPKIKPSE